MFIGHYAPALIAAAHPRAPRLGALFLAAQLVDVIFFAFVLMGVEHLRLTPQATATNALDLYDMPYTHSLVGTLAFALAFAVGLRRSGADAVAALIGAGVVASHWLLDWLVHAPDLTLGGAGARYGLALWNWPLIEMPLELGIVALALVFYGSRTALRGPAGRWSLVGLAVALAAAQLVNWLTPQPVVPVDTPPVSLPLTALAAFAVLTALAALVDRTRSLPSAKPLQSNGHEAAT